MVSGPVAAGPDTPNGTEVLLNCFVCARDGSEGAAVAICPRCNAGLCLGHVYETASDPGPGGTRMSCNHDTWSPSWAQLPAHRPR